MIEKIKKHKENNNISINNSLLTDTINVISTAQHHSILKSTCLERSLFVYFFLSLKGIDSTIKIGVNEKSNDFLSHTWVEYDGKVINDLPDTPKNFKALSKSSLV